MKSALSQATPPPAREFADGLGVRSIIAERGAELLELLALTPDFLRVPTFETALRERVSRLANFRHAYYARVRRVDRLDGGKALAIVSEHASGARLSHILRVAERHSIDLDVNAALCLIRQIVPAIAMLHHNARDVAHGALAPERLLVTPQARIVVTDYVLGSAIEQLRLSRERLWRELQVAVPPGAGHPRLDHRADVMQIGLVSLALVLGRSLRQEELRSLSELLASATETTVLGEREPISPPLRRWLARALQLDQRSSFESAEDAQRGLDEVVSDEGGYVAAPIALEAFLTSYRQHASMEPDAADEEPRVPTTAPPLAPAAIQVSAPAPAPVLPAAVAPPLDPPVIIEPIAAAPVRREPAFAATPEASPFAQAKDEPEPPPYAPPPPARGQGRRLERIALGVCVLIVIAQSAYIWMSSRRTAGAVPADAGVLSVDSRPAGATVIVDGRERGLAPLELELPPGAHVLELRAGAQSRVLPLSVRAGVVHAQYVEMPAANAAGTLEVKAAPGARVLVDGQLRGTAPLTMNDLPPGEHDVAVETPEGVSRQTVAIAAGVTAVADFLNGTAPAAAPTAGWVSVRAPYEMQVFVEGRLVGSSASSKIELAPGLHTLDLVNDTLAFRTSKTVEVAIGRVARVDVDLPLGSISINATPWAEVWIDGERVGETPIGNLPIRIGPHEVVFKHPELGEQHQAVSVTLAAPARLSVNMTK
jgi:hypothetical protein